MSVLATIFSPRAQTSTLSRPMQWLIDVITGEKTTSGENVNAKTAMGIPAWFAGIRNISEDIAKLPRFTFKNLKPNGREKAPEHPSFRLVHDAPNEEMSAMEFHETIMSHALGWCGGFGEIIRRGDGRPEAIWLLDPNTVQVERSEAGKLRYRVRVDGIQDVFLRPDQVFHIHGLGFDGITGYCMSQLLRETLGSVMAARRFGGTFFGNGAQPSGMLEVPAGFSPGALENLRKSFAERHEGRENKNKTMMLEAGVTFKPISHDPEKSQMIETVEFGVEDVCRILRIPPHKVGHYKRAQGWSTLEMTNTEYVVDTLMPWLVRLEQEYKLKLFSPRETDFYVKHIVNGLLRGDAAARSAFYTTGFQNGYLSQNDIRELEDMNPIGPDGDTYYVPLNLVPSEFAVEGPPEPKPPAPPAPPDEEKPKPPAPKDSSLKVVLDIAQTHKPLLADALARVLRVEATKVKQASKKGAVAALADSFYAEHAQHVHGAIGGVIDAFSAAAFVAMRGEMPSDAAKSEFFTHTKAQAEQHVRVSLNEIADAQKVARWESGERATLKADDMMSALVELAVRLSGSAK